MAVSNSAVLWNVPRRIIRPVINAKNRSTWFNQELLVGGEMEVESVPLLGLQETGH